MSSYYSHNSKKTIASEVQAPIINVIVPIRITAGVVSVIILLNYFLINN